MGSQFGESSELLVVSIQRADVLKALSVRPLRRAEIEETVDVSRTTAHRIARSLTDHGLVERTDAGFVLTPLGEAIAAEVNRVQDTVKVAANLQPILEALSETAFVLDVSLFTDAVITASKPGDPYAPVSRFMELLTETETLRGFDTTSIAPLYVDEIRDEILGGMETSVIYQPAVAQQIADSYPDELDEARESDRLELFTSESLPFGLALYDERIGVGAYDSDTGMLKIFVDTDNPEAIKWGESLYEYYRNDADPFFPPDTLS